MVLGCVTCVQTAASLWAMGAAGMSVAIVRYHPFIAKLVHRFKKKNDCKSGEKDLETQKLLEIWMPEIINAKRPDGANLNKAVIIEAQESWCVNPLTDVKES